MKKILYFDCLAGISGDMTIGALLDLGIDQDEFRRQLQSIPLEGYEIKIQKKLSSHIGCTDFDVIIPDDPARGEASNHSHDHQPNEHHHTHEHPQDHAPEHHHQVDHPHEETGHHHIHRNLYDIHHIIDHADIPPEAKRLSKAIFQTIGEAEAYIHQKTIDKIHFHEVGAIDSIVDIVGTAIAISMLNIDKIIASPLHVGTGTVKCAHGVLPVPAPATARILRGIPIYSTGVQGELVTPTGAAIIKNLATAFSPLPNMIVDEIGYGSGKKEMGIANLLRVFSGKAETSEKKKTEFVSIIETNIDDMNPEIYSHIIPRILEQGALDVYMTNIIMKKGRPGVKVTVLCKPEQESRFEDMLLLESTTLGTRKYQVERSCLDRKVITVDSAFGPVEIKQAFRNGTLIKSAPEFESCRKIADEKRIPIREVYQALSQLSSR